MRRDEFNPFPRRFARRRTLLLFPDDRALTVEGVREGYVEKYCRSTAVDGVSAIERGMSEVALHENGVGKEPLQIMVVDGTWRQVKAMVKELDRVSGE